MRNNWLNLTVAVLMAGSLWSASTWAQFDGGGIAGGADTGNPATRGAGKPVEIVKPTVDQKDQSITMPAAFWNERLTDWVEVAMCGRPSDFLHETIICVTTTKAQMMHSLREAGFVDADAWVSNVADFPRIRGDKAIILLEVDRNGKKETYSLDELLIFQGWNVSIGPFGWMYKGEPGEAPRSATQTATREDGRKLTVREQILRDDPQVALQFRGIQHLSQSFIDHPLCYDDWLYPTMRYFRNDKLLPMEVYNSNGDVPVRMTMKKISEAEYLRQSAKYWHDPEYAKYMLKQVPVAEEIDQNKAELLKTLPGLQQRIKAVREGANFVPVTESEEFAKVALLAAAIEKDYAVLDEAWTIWAADHAQWSTQELGEIKDLEQERKLWREHMADKKMKTEWLWKAEIAREAQRTAKDDESKKKARGEEILARGEALLAGNRQIQEYWKNEFQRTAPDDPRKDWLKHLALQVELNQAREQVGKTGIAYGTALAKGQDTAAAKTAYDKALLQANLANMRLDLADVEFEITKREGMNDEPELPGLIAKRDTLKNQIKTIEATTQNGGGK